MSVLRDSAFILGGRVVIAGLEAMTAVAAQKPPQEKKQDAAFGVKPERWDGFTNWRN